MVLLITSYFFINQNLYLFIFIIRDEPITEDLFTVLKMIQGNQTD